MNGVVKQFQKFWTELGNNQKVSLILAAVMVIAAMAALVMWSGKPQMVMLYGGMDTKDMADVVKTLDDQSITYEIRPGNSIFVAKENVYKVRMDLASKGVPTGGSVGYEIFDRTGFGVSDFVQRTNYSRAVQGELQRTIMQLRGVRTARVMIVMPQNRLMVSDKPVHATASVMVETGGKTLEQDAVNSIRFLVANSVEGLDANDVVVVDANGNDLTADLAQDKVIGAATGQFKFRKHLEDYFTGKVETMLARVVGQQNVVARVSVDLDTQATSITEDKFDPNGQVVRSQTQSDEVNRSSDIKGAAASTGSSVSNGTAGAAGVTGNTPVAAAGTNGANTALAGGQVAESPRSTTEESRKNKSVNYEINHSRTETVRAPGSVSRVSAAVFIARRFTETDGKKVEQPRTPEELENLRQMVVQALGVEESAGATRTVTLSEADFAVTVDPAEALKPDFLTQILTWMDMMKNFVAVGFAALMFLLFLRMLKKHKPEPYSLEIMDDEAQDNKKGADAIPRLTPELLNELIREKPENVSTALRNWAVESSQNKK
jgi:flagellar M-ring protein FliF